MHPPTPPNLTQQPFADLGDAAKGGEARLDHPDDLPFVLPPTGFRAGFLAATFSLLLIALIGINFGWLIAFALLSCTTSFCAGLIVNWK